MAYEQMGSLWDMIGRKKRSAPKVTQRNVRGSSTIVREHGSSAIPRPFGFMAVRKLAATRPVRKGNSMWSVGSLLTSLKRVANTRPVRKLPFTRTVPTRPTTQALALPGPVPSSLPLFDKETPVVSRGQEDWFSADDSFNDGFMDDHYSDADLDSLGCTPSSPDGMGGFLDEDKSVFFRWALILGGGYLFFKKTKIGRDLLSKVTG